MSSCFFWLVEQPTQMSLEDQQATVKIGEDLSLNQLPYFASCFADRWQNTNHARVQ